jgi:hypothetical protein
MRKLTETWNRLVVSGGAERRRRTTRRCIRNAMEYVLVRRISANAGCISLVTFVMISSMKSTPQYQFSVIKLQSEGLHKLQIRNSN